MERKLRLHTFFPSCSLGAAEGVAVRVYTPLGKKEGGQFALDVASTHSPPPTRCSSHQIRGRADVGHTNIVPARTLSYFEDYFGIAYPLPKLDLVAAPDFAAGAMENW